MHSAISRDAILDVVDTLRTAASSYELAVVDTAPAGGVIEDAALVAADWIVVPTKADDKSLLGLHRVSQRLTALRDDGLPVGALAGVVLFAIPAAATRIRNEARRELLDAFDDRDVVFDTVIRASERGAIDQPTTGSSPSNTPTPPISSPSPTGKIQTPRASPPAPTPSRAITSRLPTRSSNASRNARRDPRALRPVS